jgi:hypothetical protein
VQGKERGSGDNSSNGGVGVQFILYIVQFILARSGGVDGGKTKEGVGGGGGGTVWKSSAFTFKIDILVVEFYIYIITKNHFYMPLCAQ